MKISESLKRFRKEFKLSQREVAAAWDATPQTYQAYEYRDVSPSADVIKKIAIAFNVSTDYLLGLSDEPQPRRPDEKEIRAAFEFRDKWQSLLRVASSEGILPLPQAVTPAATA